MQLGKDFFKKTFDEGYTEPEQVETDTPAKVEAPEKEVEVPTEVPAKVVTPVEEVPVVEVPKFNIDGEDFTLDQIKEWKQNGLRQSDYTKKTQELAEQRKALGQVETPNENVEPTDSERLRKIEMDIENKKLDLEITNLKIKYPDFDDVAIINEATSRGITDLEFIYKAMREDKSSEPIDMEAYKAQVLAEYKEQIATKKQTNKDATAGSIVSSVGGQPVTDYGDELTNQEKEFCGKRGWSYKYYVETKGAEYKI